MSNKYLERFADLSFEDFRKLAKDESLSMYEKIGFPDSYRKGKEGAIFEDIVSKLDNLASHEKTVLDIGPGCSELPRMLMQLCQRQKHRLLLVDSEEMLERLPSGEGIEKISGYYPRCEALFEQYAGKIDVILCYSVFHYVFAEQNPWEFLDRSLELLAHGGQMLIGDIPNVSKRKRFFSSPTGIGFHKKFVGKNEIPEVNWQAIEHKKIDDSVIVALTMRARQAGFDAYVVPQRPDLPMANRREDVLIIRP